MNNIIYLALCWLLLRTGMHLLAFLCFIPFAVFAVFPLNFYFVVCVGVQLYTHACYLSPQTEID